MLNVSFCNLQIYNFFVYMPTKYGAADQNRSAHASPAAAPRAAAASHTRVHLLL